MRLHQPTVPTADELSRISRARRVTRPRGRLSLHAAEGRQQKGPQGGTTTKGTVRRAGLALTPGKAGGPVLPSPIRAHSILWGPERPGGPGDTAALGGFLHSLMPSGTGSQRQGWLSASLASDPERHLLREGDPRPTAGQRQTERGIPLLGLGLGTHRLRRALGTHVDGGRLAPERAAFHCPFCFVEKRTPRQPLAFPALFLPLQSSPLLPS